MRNISESMKRLESDLDCGKYDRPTKALDEIAWIINNSGDCDLADSFERDLWSLYDHYRDIIIKDHA